MIQPPNLIKGNKVAFVAPARSVSEDEVKNAIELFEKHGLKVVHSKKLFGKHNQFSGSDFERSDDFQQYLDNPDIKAIISVRGGYGSIRTLQNINFEKFKCSPKWIVGYSDVTVFHSYINNQLGFETIQAPMPFNLNKSDFDLDSFNKTFDILFGKLSNYVFEPHEFNVWGNATGRLIGGNLSVLYSLCGTPAEFKSQGNILFVEDIDEYLYHIDRMMMNLKYGGKLHNLKGIIVGDMTDMKDNNIPFGKNAYEIIADVLSGYNIPVCYGFPAGHGKRNWPLIMGHTVSLNVSDKCSLKFL